MRLFETSGQMSPFLTWLSVTGRSRPVFAIAPDSP